MRKVCAHCETANHERAAFEQPLPDATPQMKFHRVRSYAVAETRFDPLRAVERNLLRRDIA